uniref:Uncharacterized protein n=1 Tax=Timspurckia oligopyrenoides TaxID=708627 RepID=A0A6T6MWQ0_9RHOD|mmetsp:Transcript_7347/g.13258  ORF Transcript_7347/g.13258 Transcript_7347/m.13258 type:complete len:309 (+) Transcript_7347:197-1123(+)
MNHQKVLQIGSSPEYILPDLKNLSSEVCQHLCDTLPRLVQDSQSILGRNRHVKPTEQDIAALNRFCATAGQIFNEFMKENLLREALFVCKLLICLIMRTPEVRNSSLDSAVLGSQVLIRMLQEKDTEFLIDAELFDITGELISFGILRGVDISLDWERSFHVSATYDRLEASDSLKKLALINGELYSNLYFDYGQKLRSHKLVQHASMVRAAAGPKLLDKLLDLNQNISTNTALFLEPIVAKVRRIHYAWYMNVIAWELLPAFERDRKTFSRGAAEAAEVLIYRKGESREVALALGFRSVNEMLASNT